MTQFGVDPDYVVFTDERGYTPKWHLKVEKTIGMFPGAKVYRLYMQENRRYIEFESVGDASLVALRTFCDILNNHK